jgi:hypothetical protein
MDARFALEDLFLVRIQPDLMFNANTSVPQIVKDMLSEVGAGLGDDEALLLCLARSQFNTGKDADTTWAFHNAIFCYGEIMQARMSVVVEGFNNRGKEVTQGKIITIAEGWQLLDSIIVYSIVIYY